ncbi:MAG: hypothetical protein IT255_05280 [Chitinophagaceae bacterium]|nr:hypothetical protein [Chitinophagaceae bacterium]
MSGIKQAPLRNKKLFICCILTIAMGTRAQTIERFNSFSYSVNEGLLQSTITDMAFDKNNFCWIGFPNGIQKFDGKNFTTIPIQEGLPDDKFADFFRCKNGDLLISHSMGVSKYEIATNKFKLVYRGKTNDRIKMHFIGEDENIIYLYDEALTIIGLSAGDYRMVSKTNSNLLNYSLNTDYFPIASENIINHRTVFLIKENLYLWDLKKQSLISRSDSIPSVSLFFLRLKSSNEVLYYSTKVNNALQVYNFSTKANTIIRVKGKDDEKIARCEIHQWQNKTLISFNGKLYETDSTLQVLKAELVNFQNKPFVETKNIWGIREDNFGNLYLLSVTSGIRKIIRNNYPVKYYGNDVNGNNNSMSILPDKINNRVLIGTFEGGLLIFDTLQHLVKQINILPGYGKGFTLNTIIKNNKGGYLLFINGQKKVWQLNENLSQLKPIKISTYLPEEKSGIHFFGTTLYRDERTAIALTQSMLYKINFGQGIVSEHQVTQSYTMGGLKYGDKIITHANNELIFLDAETIKEIKRIPFKNTGYVRCFAQDNANHIYVGSNNGIFKIDSTGKVLKHLTKVDGLPDDCIYAMIFDKQGLLWCSTNKGIFKLNNDGSILLLTKEDGLQENEFNTNTVAKAADGELFFGGVNGVSSFYPTVISGFEDKVNLFISKVTVNNEVFSPGTAFWNLKDIELPYNRNSLSIDFIAMGNNNPDQYIYQYMMTGIDNEWIQNNGMQEVRYSLPPGEYVFKLYASHVFDKEAKPMKEIHISILPPFWKSWWFRTMLGLLLILGIAYTVNRYIKNKYEKKLLLLESEHKIQLERERISRDLHDSIGAYANAVLYNTELLQQDGDTNEKQELMNDLKYASKDIITSLRETVWALKKEYYTEEECFLRIRNFMQTLTRYYPHIKFVTEGEAPAGKQLHHAKALNVVRIMQEAVTNAIKHAAPGRIIINSSKKEDSWLLQVNSNGKGFNYDEIKNNGQGNGLHNMKDRAKESGLDIHIVSSENSGSNVSLLI